MLHVLAQAAPALRNPPIVYHAVAPELVLAGTIFLVLMVDLALGPGRKWMSMPFAFCSEKAVQGPFARVTG